VQTKTIGGMDYDWRQQLRELVEGPYAGRGGLAALARALRVCPESVRIWLSETPGSKGMPIQANHRSRASIRRLYERVIVRKEDLTRFPPGV